MQYMRRMKNLPVISAGLVIVNCIVFLLGMGRQDMLHSLGGIQKTAILEYHEYGRFLWAMFLHADVRHLFNNMLILYFLGSMLEKEVGHVWFGIIYFVSGIGGNLISLLYKVMKNSEGLSIGASGAVFGLNGLLLALVILFPGFRRVASPGRVFLMILLSLYSGFVGTNIDNAAHVGGLLVGFVTGVLCVSLRNWSKKGLRNMERCSFEG